MNDNEIMEKYKKYEPFFSNWYLKRFIGEGGFAKVFEIVRNDFGREYVSALKIITISKTKSEINTLRSEGMTDEDIKGYLKNIVEDTVSEIQLMYKLRGNGNIVGYEDHAVMEHEDGMGWDILIKMEYLTSLSSYIREQKGQLTKRDVLKLGVDICKALEVCQKYNIIHRDIKADNIFISENGEFKLGDFGIARVIERKDQTLSKKGTSSYMAPEVYRGQTYTSAVDIYSLGMVLYRLLNNNRGPFLPEYPKPMSLDDRDRALMMRMSGEIFPAPSQVEKSRLTEIVLKACAYRPEERYSSPGFMRQELEALFYSQDEVTNDTMITIYVDQGGETSFSLGDSGVVEVQKEDDATEVLREEDDVTEVMREDDDATEVLREETPNAAVQSYVGNTGTSSLYKTCVNCGKAIKQEALFCTICGANQAEWQPIEETKQTVLSKWKKKMEPKKLALIGGVCAAVLILAGTTIGIVVSRSSSDDAAEESSSADPSSDEIVKKKDAWSENVLMTLDLMKMDDVPQEYIPTESDKFLNTGLRRGEIGSITFVDSLDAISNEAWDVSADGNGKVMAWSQRGDEGYDLFIGGDGGVGANKDCVLLFAGMSSLKQITINGCFHTENVEDMTGMFYECYALQAIDLSSFDTSGVIDMNSMFYSCQQLTELDLNNFDTSQVTDMSAMFMECTSLTEINISNFDTSQVTDMSGMFLNCTNLTELDVSGFDTSNVTDMQYMFSDCINLVTLNVRWFDTSKVTNMSGLFMDCESLTSLNVSNFKTSKVTDMTAMFFFCSSLTELDVSGFDTAAVKDMSYMFSGCSSLTRLDVSGFQTDSLLHTDSMFVGCDNLTNLDISNFDSFLVDSMGYTGNQTAQQGQVIRPAQIPDEFVDLYHEDFVGYDSWGWHETYVYKDESMAPMHILYLNPSSEDGAELAVRWHGPQMDSGYEIDEDFAVTLYGSVDGLIIYRLRMFAMPWSNRSLRNEGIDLFMNLLSTTEKNSAVAKDDEQAYYLLVSVDADWQSDIEGYVYFKENTEEDIIYVFEYLTSNEFFDAYEMGEVVLDMATLDLKELGVDKVTGLIGQM